MSWAAYVKDVIGDDTQSEAGRKTGVDQTTLSRWLNGERRSITSVGVTRFAQGYGVPVLEAFVHAGLITAEDAEVDVIDGHLDQYRLDQLLAEVARRATQVDVS